MDSEHDYIIQFISGDDGAKTGSQLQLPGATTHAQINEILLSLLEPTDSQPNYSFYINNHEIGRMDSLKIHAPKDSTEKIIEVTYVPQALFKVRPATRNTGTMQGHGDSILCVQFSCDGKQLASAGGDTTVRLWDLNTHTALSTLKGHTDWVMALHWSPLSNFFVTGSKDKTVRLWDPRMEKCASLLKGHNGFIHDLAWEPLATSTSDLLRFASASRDGTTKIWDTRQNRALHNLSGHSQSVTSVAWGGEGKLYTGSRDKTIHVHETNSFKLIKTLKGHAHWINHLSLNSDFVLRLGPFDEHFLPYSTTREALTRANENYRKFITSRAKREILISSSDDGTLCLWDANQPGKKPLSRMTGHQQQVMSAKFSPNGILIASASLDRSVKLWKNDGTFLATLRGHVGAVYQLAWSSDSRLLCSASKDSTLKIWDISRLKLRTELPGHEDEVFSVDWSPDGQAVASGSYDRTVKIWRH